MSRRITCFTKKHDAIRLGLLIILLVSFFYGGWLSLKFTLQTNYPVLVVVSESMIPVLNVGDLIVIQGKDPQEIDGGTIIVFHSPRDYHTLIVHRVVEIVRRDSQIYFRTKGDHNSAPDNWSPSPGVPANHVVGAYSLKIPYLGYIVMVMREPVGIIFVVFMIALIILLEFLGSEKKKKKSGLDGSTTTCFSW